VSLRIALVTETYLPEVNGVAITLGCMVAGLLQRQHHVHLIRPKQSPQDTPQQNGTFCETLVTGMPIIGYPGLKTGLPAKRTLLKLWRQHRPDIVHVATEGPLGWSAVAAARELNLPISSDFHTNFHHYSQHYGIGWLQKPIAAYLRYLHNRTGCTLVPTKELQQSLIEQGYERVEVVARGVDAELFHPAKRSTELRACWGADEHTPVVMLVSRIAAEKNLSLVIETFYAMRKVQPTAVLVMVGDGPARPALQQQYPDVIFVGMKTGEDLATHYASGDVFLYPSLTETYGNVTIEAMSSGLAVVAYQYAAAREHIRHGINGLLAPYSDTAAFTAQAVNLMLEPQQIQSLRSAARHSIAELTWEKIMCDLEAVLLNTIATQGVKHVQPELTAATD
jgi:glycosyltransferase involved in cell wall biosynthesis